MSTSPSQAATVGLAGISRIAVAPAAIAFATAVAFAVSFAFAVAFAFVAHAASHRVNQCNE